MRLHQTKSRAASRTRGADVVTAAVEETFTFGGSQSRRRIALQGPKTGDDFLRLAHDAARSWNFEVSKELIEKGKNLTDDPTAFDEALSVIAIKQQIVRTGMLGTGSMPQTAKVDAFVIGPPKTMTTWLYHFFRTNPEHFYVPPGKETRFFGNFELVTDGSYYDEIYPAGEGRISVDATPSTALLPMERIEALKERFPDAHIILTRRNPVGRAWSQFKHSIRFSELPGSPDGKPIQVDGAGLATWMRWPTILLGSQPDLLRSRWESVFGSDQVLEVDTTKLSTSPVDEIERIISFLTRIPMKLRLKHRRVNAGNGPDCPDWFRPFLAALFDPSERCGPPLHLGEGINRAEDGFRLPDAGPFDSILEALHAAEQRQSDNPKLTYEAWLERQFALAQQMILPLHAPALVRERLADHRESLAKPAAAK